MLKKPVEVWLPRNVDIPHCDINLAFIVGNNLNSYNLRLCQLLAQMRTIENMHFITILLQWIPHYNGHPNLRVALVLIVYDGH